MQLPTLQQSHVLTRGPASFSDFPDPSLPRSFVSTSLPLSKEEYVGQEAEAESGDPEYHWSQLGLLQPQHPHVAVSMMIVNSMIPCYFRLVVVTVKNILTGSGCCMLREELSES